MKARGGRRDAPGKVLKDRRSPRERGRTGTSVTRTHSTIIIPRSPAAPRVRHRALDERRAHARGDGQEQRLRRDVGRDLGQDSGQDVRLHREDDDVGDARDVAVGRERLDAEVCPSRRARRVGAPRDAHGGRRDRAGLREPSRHRLRHRPGADEPDGAEREGGGRRRRRRASDDGDFAVSAAPSDPRKDARRRASSSPEMTARELALERGAPAARDAHGRGAKHPGETRGEGRCASLDDSSIRAECCYFR